MRRFLLSIIGVIVSALSWGQTGHFISSDNFSSSLISCLCQDQQGSVWIATDYGLNRFDGYRFHTFLHDDADSTSMVANVVVTLLTDDKGRLWVGTNRGLDRFDADRELFIHYPFPDGLSPRVSTLLQRKDGSLLVGTAGYGCFTLDANDKLKLFSLGQGDHFFSNMFEDSRGRLWRSGFDDRISLRTDNDEVRDFVSPLGTPQAFAEQNDELLVLCQHGILSFHNNQFTEADIDMSAVSSKDQVFTQMVVGSDGTIYVGSRGQGLYRVSRQHPRRLEPVDMNAYGIDQRTAMINNLMFDRHGNLWLGCHRKGLLILPQRPVQFTNWSFNAQGVILSSTISSVCEGDGGIIWSAVQGVGIYGFDAAGHVVAHPKAPDAVEFIFRDRLQRYWVGTDDALFSYDPLTGRYEKKVVYDCDKFNDMTSDLEGRIYISAFSRGFCVYDPQTGGKQCYDMDSPSDSVRGRLCNNWIMGISSDRQGLIWMATSSGVSCFDPKTASFRSQGWETLLDGIVCFDVCELRSGQLADGRQLDGCVAIGTEQGLYLYDRESRKVEPFPGGEQLTNKAICYVVQANDGDVWCSTSMGIWQYQLSSHSFLGHVNGNGLMQKEYLYGVGMHTDNDQIFFGNNEGLTVFRPNDIKESHVVIDSLQLVLFRVGAQRVNLNTVLNGVQVTEKPVNQSDHFTLSYLDHTITMAFSPMDFNNSMNLSYEYRVNDGEWIRNSQGVNDFTLSHLQPGTYTIQVRASQGNVYSPEKTFQITIRAPWYRSKIAYVIYFLIVLAFVLYVFFTYRRRAAEQMYEEKMKFLINATHDIRSPLTLIMSPLANLKRRIGGEQSDALRDIDTIDRNTKRILNLVNQILDVRKIDKQQMQLHCQETDIVSFTRGIYKMYEYNAQERNIKFLFQVEGGDESQFPQVWLDRNQFDKVISNLLSNAFKYSYEEGTIEIRLSHDEQNVQIQVIDTGTGLDSESLKHIFDRFYQGGNSRRLHIDGTGIGLNLCKMIVDMHHGTIDAANRSDGKNGSIFTVTLPLGTAHLTEAEMEQIVEEQPVEPVRAVPKTQASKYRVLVVDDDVEIARYIASELGHYYRFGICNNGKEGLKELLTNEYDLVVSDVMMPEMDGFTMLRMIKTNLNISHLPVVMLTSKADVGNRLEGLERGADAFLAKPFDMEELHMVIENLIHNRQRLKGKFSGAQQQADKLELPEVKGNDEQLMERIMKVVNKNLSNSDFNVDMLTQEVGISRAQLHRKMKELTGISTSEFIRNIRLEQAARLLKEQKINVTQVAYTVGFSNLAHFSTIFRKHFGVSPSEYAERDADS